MRSGRQQSGRPPLPFEWKLPMSPLAGHRSWGWAVHGLREAASLGWRWHARRIRPRGIAVSITNRCDLRCRHCERGLSGRTPVDLPLRDVRRLLDLAAKCRVRLLLTGGEPTLHPDFVEILTCARRRGVRLELNTNGFSLAGADASTIALVNKVVELLRISLDSADPSEHDAWRGTGQSHARALELLCDTRLRCPREISTVLALDLHNAGPLLQVALQAGCPVTFQPLIFNSNYPDLAPLEWKLEQQQAMPGLAAGVAAALPGLAREAQALGVETNLAVLESFLEAYYRAACGPGHFMEAVAPRFICVIPHQRLTVDERGRLAPCVFQPGDTSIRGGDILEQWRHAALVWRKNGSSHARSPACRSCGCYFAENLRANVILSPFRLRAQLLALVAARMAREREPPRRLAGRPGRRPDPGHRR